MNIPGKTPFKAGVDHVCVVLVVEIALICALYVTLLISCLLYTCSLLTHVPWKPELWMSAFPRVWTPMRAVTLTDIMSYLVVEPWLHTLKPKGAYG